MRVLVYLNDIIIAAGISHILHKENIEVVLIDSNQLEFNTEDTNIIICCPNKLKDIQEKFKSFPCRPLLILEKGNADVIANFIEDQITGILYQQEIAQFLNTAINLLQSTGYYFSPQITLKLAQNQSKQQIIKTLSKRELEIVDLLLDDASTTEISSSLFLSPNTVSTHRKNIFRKLDIHDVNELKLLFSDRV